MSEHQDAWDASGPEAQPGLPRIGEPAPHFAARTTHGPRTLEDYRGEWLILFSHPADFTPVCTSEFVALERARPDFEGRGCKLLALSADSVFSHLAWIRSIREAFGVSVGFPIVEDMSMGIARAYGMVHPRAGDTSTIRAVFFIDPHGIVRAITYYPMTVGRSIPEMLRCLAALQTAEKGGVSVPADWQLGDDVLAPPPVSADEMDRLAEAPGNRDWYFRTVRMRNGEIKGT